MPKVEAPAVERIIANTINETARGDPDALAARSVAALVSVRGPESAPYFLFAQLQRAKPRGSNFRSTATRLDTFGGWHEEIGRPRGILDRRSPPAVRARNSIRCSTTG